MKRILPILLIGVFIGWYYSQPRTTDKSTFDKLNKEYSELIKKGASKDEISVFYNNAMEVYKEHLISEKNIDAAQLLLLSNSKTMPVVAADKLFDVTSNTIKASPELEKIWNHLKSKPLK